MFLLSLLLAVKSLAGLVSEHKFAQHSGQVVRDSVGTNHLVSGTSLEEESQDVLFTDRGIYLTPVSFLKFPENALSQTSFTLNSLFSIAMWILPKNSGTLFSRFNPSNAGLDVVVFSVNGSQLDFIVEGVGTYSFGIDSK